MKICRIVIILMLVALVVLFCITAFAPTKQKTQTIPEKTIIVQETTEEIMLAEVKTEELEVFEEQTEETKSVKTEPEYFEVFKEVPLYNQKDYEKTRYGDSTVKKSGCAITCYAMVLSYLLDREVLPDELADKYHMYKVEGGSSHYLFTQTQEEWGVKVENCYWEEAWGEGRVIKALKNGQPIIANVHADSVFTNDAHFIVLYGLSEQGKILVRDPYGANYISKLPLLVEGFANGFEPEYFSKISANYFIYQAKEIVQHSTTES